MYKSCIFIWGIYLFIEENICLMILKMQPNWHWLSAVVDYNIFIPQSKNVYV